MASPYGTTTTSVVVNVELSLLALIVTASLCVVGSADAGATTLKGRRRTSFALSVNVRDFPAYCTGGSLNPRGTAGCSMVNISCPIVRFSRDNQSSLLVF